MNKLKIIIHPSFLIMLFIGLYGGFIKEVLLFSLIVLLHETGHFIAAKLFKVKYYAIHLTIIGCMIDLEDFSNIRFYKKIIINSAGIVINILLIIICYKLNLQILVDYNKLMIIINLLPIHPLDGYKIIYSLITLIFDDEYTTDCLFYLSMIVLVIITISILILKLYGFLLILVFLYYKSIKNKLNSHHQKLTNLLLKKMQYF